MKKNLSLLIINTSVLGSVLSLALTNLRFNEFFGIGELLMLISLGLFVFSSKSNNYKNLKNKIPTVFLLSFVLINFLAFVYVLFFVPNLHDNLYYDGFIRTFVAYLFGILNAIVLFLTIKETQIDFFFKTVLRCFNFTYFFTFIALYGVLISDLDSGERFLGFALNPNQHGTLLVTIPFISLYLFNKKEIKLWFFIFTLFISFVLIKAIISDAVYYSLVVCSFMLFFMKIKSIKFEAKIFLAILSIFIFYFFIYDNLLEYVLDTNQNADQASVRFILWYNGFQAFLSSPFIGFGAGAYSGDFFPFSYMECHNTFIDLLTNVGLIGFIYYLSFLFNSVRINFLNKNIYIVLILASLVIFSLFHNILRHPSFWLIIFSVYFVSKNQNQSYSNSI